MIRRIAALTVTLLFLAVAGCNTVEGFGKDVKKLGEEIEDSSK